jgi:hypothetical protein
MPVSTIGGAAIDSFNFNGTGAALIPSGTTAQRPTSPVNGMIRFNTTLGLLEEFRDSGWRNLSNVFFATGGVESTYTVGSINYKVHVFTSSGNFVVSSGSKDNVEFLIVAGGGGGGVGTNGNDCGGGGAGAGGYISSVVGELSGQNSSVVSRITAFPQSYTVVVGTGGAGGTVGVQGTSGNPSSVFGITATGGGGGSNRDSGGRAGGSGGGGSCTGIAGSGTSGQGFQGGGAGGTPAGGTYGGGGAGGFDNTVRNAVGGPGGVGIASSITGSSVFRGGGGGGGGGQSTGGAGGNGGGGTGGNTGANNGGAGTANTGGGGGGGGGFPNSGTLGGNGGSGVVIIRYQV